VKPKPFRFRLARVMRVRGLLERAARADWGASAREAAEQAALASGASADLAAARAALAAAQAAGRADPSSVLAADVALDSMGRHVAHRRTEADLAGVRERDRREDWTDRRRDHEALKALRERRRSEHRIALRREEALQMDEVARGLAGRGDGHRDPDRRGSSPLPGPADSHAGTSVPVRNPHAR
jgi:hypothetical protein